MFLKALTIGSFLIAILGIFWICTFKVLDRDFWWHIKAGEIMWQTGELIRVDPFSYTREGLPYLSSHQWLAQVVMYGVWFLGGATAQILVRGALVAAAFSLVLLIDTKRIWPNFFVVLIAAYFNRPSFMDRPQLFSFVFFCAFLFAATYYLRRADRDSNIYIPWRIWFLAVLVLLQVLWVNMHGAAATYGIIIVCALVAERAVEWLRSASAAARVVATKELQYLAVVIFGLVVGAVVSPNGLRTFQDVFVYTNDQTLGLVREWQPRGFAGYMKDIAPFVALAAVSLLFGKRHRVYSTALALVFGYLSTQSYRHGIFFIFSALAIGIYQAGSIATYRKWISSMLRTKYIVFGVTLAVLGGMYWFATQFNIHVLQREGYSGYGVAASAEDAYAFVEENNLQGNMFNTYGIGDYVLYRGYPNRKVYIDGRNIDYGYDFLREATSAAFDSSVWKRIEKKYDLTYAIIEYPLAPGAEPENDLSYVVHLSNNKDWALVYIDDKIAVYVKRTKEHAEIVSQYEYTSLTPEGLEFGSALQNISGDDVAKGEKELLRASTSSAKSIKARLILAHHFSEEKKYEEAALYANAAADAQPYRPEVYEAMGIVAAGMGQFAQAGSLLEESIEKMGWSGLPVNYEFLADIFTKAGDVAKSSYYRQKAK